MTAETILTVPEIIAQHGIRVDYHHVVRCDGYYVDIAAPDSSRPSRGIVLAPHFLPWSTTANTSRTTARTSTSSNRPDGTALA